MVKQKEPFELMEHLGTGAFAQTWLAKVIDPDLIEEWHVEESAIKIPLTKQKERALRRELELTGSLHLQLSDMEQENIVKYLGFEVFEGKLVMVMEYIKGGNLRSLIGEDGRRKHVGTKKAIKMMLGILSGLDIIHKKHIIHRDIKPENILMDGDVPKITDLGIGRMLRPDELAYTKGVGTLFYMPPEILYSRFGVSYSYNADIWSVGIMFYEMLSCQFPFGMTNTMSMGVITDLIKDEAVQLVFPSKELVPPQLQAILAKALRRNPIERYKTAGEILKDLKEFLRGSDEAVDSEIGLIQQLILDPARSKLAESKLSELQERFPDSPRIYLHLGEFYNRQGNYGKAIQILNKGVERDPENSVLYWDLAIAHEKKGNAKLAVEYLQKALAFGLEGSLERYAKTLLKTLEKKA